MSLSTSFLIVLSLIIVMLFTILPYYLIHLLDQSHYILLWNQLNSCIILQPLQLLAVGKCRVEISYTMIWAGKVMRIEDGADK